MKENNKTSNEDDQAFRPFPIPKTQLSEIEEGSNKIVIPGLRADFQADVVDAVLSEIGLMFIDGKSDVTIVEAARVVLDKIQNKFYNLDFFLKMDRDELLSYKDGAYFDKNRVNRTKKTEYLKLVLDNKDVIYRLVQSSLKQASIFKQGANRKEPFNESKQPEGNVIIDTKTEIIEDEVVETNEIGELPEDDAVEFNKATYTENLVDKISVEVKKFLSGIIVVDNEMNPVKNWFGYQATINYRTVYEQVQSATLGLEPDINTIIEALEKKTASTPWMRQVIDRIIKAPSFIKNRLVKNLTNHMNRMVFVLYNIDASGFTTFTVADANENGVKQVLLKQWNEDHAMEGLYDEITGDSIRSKFKELDDIYSSWSGTPSVEEIVSWFKSFGITTKEETISRLIERHNREGLNILTDVNSPIYNLSYFITNSSEYGGNITKGSPINTSPSIIKLAEETAKDSDTVVASSFRAGVKTVYSFGTNKFLVNRIRDLRNLLNIDKLLSIPFNKNSFMLNELKRDENFRDTLNYFTVSLEAIKQRNKSSRNKRSMSEISKAEIEVFKIANFQALRKKVVTIKNRTSSYYANFLTPTTSDKPTVMGITTKLAPIKYTDEGTLTTDSYHFLFDQIIRCEMDRIIHVHMMNKDKKSNNNGDFSKNGLLFHIIPQLNDLDYMWNDKETGEINPNVLDRNSTEYAQIMNDVLIPTLEAELNVKKQLWRDSGIGYGTSVLTPFLDVTYIDGLSLNKKYGESDSDYYNRKVDLAALDMVLQYKVAYVNMFNSMFTDIANYSKGNNKKTWDNVMKRLAGAIAPRLETQHPDKEIKYLFIKDPSSKSRQINEIKELIGDKKSQNYEKIDEADAQEWITLYEFIGSLIADGAIKTEGLGELIRDTITKEVAKGNYNYENEIRRAIVAKFHQAKNADGTTPKNTVLDEYLSITYQPQKPVFFGAEYDSVNNLEDVVYIKSSAFVLVPGLSPMHDKMRILAERNGVQRIVTASTSVKLGSVTNPIDPWLKDEDGNIVGFNEEITDEQLETSSKTLSRSNWGIQLEKQYNPDTHTVNKVSQASKNLLNGMLDVSGFVVNGVEMTGREVRDHYNELFSTIYKNQYDKFANKLGLVFNTKGNVIAFNVDKVRDVIVEEAISRNYYPQELEAILLDYELTGITFASNSSKIEPLLNALVEKNVLKIKMEGKQFTVGSETMFTGDLTNSNIVTTDSYQGYLSPSKKVAVERKIMQGQYHCNNDTVPALNTHKVPALAIRPAQVLMPWIFQADMSKYVKDGKLNISKIDPKALKGLAMRIPNQGPNSQFAFEIVGFLPKEMGDLIIAPKDFVIQIGHSFNFDSLYTYLYATVEYNGILRVITQELFDEVSQDNEMDKDDKNMLLHRLKKGNAIVKNKIIDTHIAIHSNPSDVVQSTIKTPVGKWVLSDVAAEIDEMKKAKKEKDVEEINKKNEAIVIKNMAIVGANEKNNTNNELLPLILIPKTVTQLSDEEQTKRFISVTNGIAGMRFYSLFNTFLSVINQSDNTDKEDQIVYKTFNNGVKQDWKINIGGITSNGRLDEAKSLDNKTLKTQIAAVFQSISVDNVNDVIMDKINLNKQTFRFTIGAITLGFTEEFVWLMNQPIIVDYVTEITASSKAGVRVFNAEEKAYDTVYKRYKNQGNLRLSETGNFYEEKNKLLKKSHLLTVEYMKKMIADGAFREDTNLMQLVALVVFIEIENVGFSLHNAMRDTNTDSAGLGINLLTTNAKENKLLKTMRTSRIVNIDKILGSFDGDKITPKTINGFATVYGLFANNTLWDSIMPYNKPIIMNFFDDAASAFSFKKDNTEATIMFKAKIWSNLKSFIFTDPRLLAIDDTVENERRRLFVDSTIAGKENTSLASYIKDLKKTQKSHTFINILNSNIELNTGRPSTLTVTNAKLDSVDINNIYAGFIDMIVNNRKIPKFNGKEYSTRQMAQDLALVALLSGGVSDARNYIKLVPPVYLYNIKDKDESDTFIEKLSKLMVADNFGDLFDKVDAKSILMQIAANNIDLIPVIASSKLNYNRVTEKYTYGEEGKSNGLFIVVPTGKKNKELYMNSVSNEYVKVQKRGQTFYRDYDFSLASAID